MDKDLIIHSQQEQLRLQARLITEQCIMISGQSTMINEQHNMIKLLEAL